MTGIVILKQPFSTTAVHYGQVHRCSRQQLHNGQQQPGNVHVWWWLTDVKADSSFISALLVQFLQLGKEGSLKRNQYSGIKWEIISSSNIQLV